MEKHLSYSWSRDHRGRYTGAVVTFLFFTTPSDRCKTATFTDVDMANYLASERPQDPFFPLPPAKRRRIGSSQQPSHLLPQLPLPSSPLPPLTHVLTPSRSRGRPRKQFIPIARHGLGGKPRLAFISEFHNVPEESRVHDLEVIDIKCDKCHALF